MNIFVSGGAGFIGSHIVGRLIHLPHISSIYVYDNFSSGTKVHLKDFLPFPKLKIIEADLKNLDQLKSSMKEIDLVIHFAANPDIAKAVTQPDIDFWEGTYLTQNILEAMRVNNVKHVLYTYGSGVYGERPDIKFQESYLPCFPISTYCASKLACEALISSYCHMFHLFFACSLPSNECVACFSDFHSKLANICLGERML